MNACYLNVGLFKHLPPATVQLNACYLNIGLLKPLPTGRFIYRNI